MPVMSQNSHSLRPKGLRKKKMYKLTSKPNTNSISVMVSKMFLFSERVVFFGGCADSLQLRRCQQAVGMPTLLL